MLDFPQFTKDTFPGVTHMDIYSALFGDITDDTMFTQRPGGGDRRQVPAHLQQRADQSCLVG